MGKVRILAIPLLAVLVLLMGAGTCGSAPPVLPTPGEWTASIDIGELRFTVSPDSTTIGNFVVVIPQGIKGAFGPGLRAFGSEETCPITDGRFTAKLNFVVVQGEFGETGTHASGTWEISWGGEIISGTWEASAP